MNRKVLLIIIVALFYFGCKGKTGVNISDATTKQGVVVDSAVKVSALKTIADTGNIFILAKLDVTAYEDGKPVEKLGLTGVGLPLMPISLIDNDTLQIALADLSGEYSLNIKKYRDSCWVWHFHPARGSHDSIYRVAGDPGYQSSLKVPCKFYVVLNKPSYRNFESAYGYIEAVTEDFFVKSKTGDIRSSVEYKGYFKTYVTTNENSSQ